MPDAICVVWICLAALVGLGVGIGVTLAIVRRQNRQNLSSAQNRAEEILTNARKEAENVLKESELKAKDEVYQQREKFNKEAESTRTELRDQERRIEKREDALDSRQAEMLNREKSLQKMEQKLQSKKDDLETQLLEVDDLIQKQMDKLHEIAHLDQQQAEAILLEQLEANLSEDIANRIQRHEDYLQRYCEERSREVLTSAIQRYAAEHTAETTVSTVDIPSDDMKGRIIGREGRNIRTFEKVTGVDVIVDDTPGVVIVSAFDNIRREVAKIALSQLIQDGRIHPTRIEEVVKETQEEMERHIMDTGRNACLDVNVPNLHDKLVQLLGRLQFRTSYSQNVLKHSLEVSHLCGLMADEMGFDGVLARRCGLLHDIGKAADHEMEGGHPKIGADLARRYGETSKEVLHAIAGHHDDVTLDHIYTVLVAAADAISASRPGARRETLEKYVKRLEELETLASGFPGVEHAYAIQAGRELRVIVNAVELNDHQAVKTCRDIAKAIEQQLNYPGEIKVTVVRETRAVEMAK